MRTLLALLTCLLGSASAFAQADPARIEGPGIRVGDTWIFNKLDGSKRSLEEISVNVVKRVDGARIVMESSSLDGRSVARIERTVAFNLVRVEGAGFTQTATPFYPNYSFPLYAGKTWNGKVVLTNTNRPGGETTAALQGRAIGWEMVTVPAGTFLALKLSVKGDYLATGLDDTLSGVIEDTLWYAPEVRNAVRYEYRDFVGVNRPWNHEIHELVRFWPGQ
ncbi:MAG: hypothetical protein HY017_13290 [Betaproteobacteria bacterium]|nr:hypothetical protein [Betaproteobacteria bacterium]